MTRAAGIPETVNQAGEWYRDAIDALKNQRQQIEEDLRFSDPSDPEQWDPEEKALRENDPGGSRPCLVMDQVGQYISNVAGQIEQRPPALHAIPVDSAADKRVAEKLDGFFRHIEHTSRATQHSARVLTSAARCGVGYYIVRPEVINRSLNYQEPRISSEGDPLKVVFDPWSVELDGSDATRGILLTPLSHAEFERLYGDKEKVSFGDEECRKSDDTRESIIVGEEWRVEDKRQTMVVYMDGDLETSVSEEDFLILKTQRPEVEPLRTYKDKYRCVKWVRMSGSEILTEEREYPASGIGIVPMYGYVGWADNRMTYCGMARRAREPQRAYNYHASEIRALMAAAPKAPWVTDIRAIKGFEKIWDRASVEQRAYLPINGIDDAGVPIPPPTRPQVTINLQNHIQGLLQAREDIQASLGMYQANLGAPSNETSGIAIDNRKAQGEASTAHFPAHLAATLGQVGKLCVEMIPRLIDTPRQLRIIGIDQTPSQVRMDPKQESALVEGEHGLTINPNVGAYDVRVVVGASFTTQRQQAQQAYTEMMRARPEMTPAIAPLWAQTLDVPHADKLAQVLTAVAPEAVRAILQPDDTESVGALKAQNEQLKMALQEATQLAQEAQQDADEAQAKLQDKAAEGDAKEDEVSIKAFEALTNRLKVLGTTLTPEAVTALAQQTVAEMLQTPDPLQQGEAQAPLAAEPMAQITEQPPAELPMEEDVNAQQVQELLAGQDQLATLMGELIRLVQAPRERIPVRKKDGSIERVLDRLAEQQPTMQ